jgi:D-3-phosphoglycerate dehydrogenase
LKKILISDPISDSGLDILKTSNFQVDYLPEWTLDKLKSHVSDANGWIVRSGTKITDELLNQAHKLQIIGRAGVGVDNINIKTATRLGIVVVNTPAVNTISAAEHTIGMMLAAARKIPQGHSGLKNGEWNRHSLVGVELSGKTLGIIGIGKIGREVMHRCRSFQMKVIGYDPFFSLDDDEITMVDLNTLIRESDFITLHLPINDDTRNLFNYSRMAKMKSTAILINVARGGIINENDLVKVLNENKIAGAALDVFSEEPLNPNHELIQTNRVILTPHLGASTREAKEGVSIAICETIKDFINHNKLTGALNIPISNFSKLSQLTPYLDLAEKLGKTHGQFFDGIVSSIKVECAGTIEDTHPITLSFLKGFLSNRVSERLNFINAESVATELGITVEKSESTDSGGYSNLIRTTVKKGNVSTVIHGTVFEDNRLTFVHFLGYDLDIEPRGTILFLKNIDVPGVVGKVGTILGKNEINIGVYLLSRKKDGVAICAIRVDHKITGDTFDELKELEEVVFLKQIRY